MPKVKITITGERVHGVGYRLFIFEEADALFIQNFDAKNVGKRAVVALAEGDGTQVKKFTDFCGSNFPADASVGDVSVEGYEGKIKSIDSFRDSLSINQLSKIARVGVDMLGKQDTMIGKQDDIINVIKDEGEKHPGHPHETPGRRHNRAEAGDCQHKGHPFQGPRKGRGMIQIIN